MSEDTDKSNTGQRPDELTREEKTELRQRIQDAENVFKRHLSKVDSIFDSPSSPATEETDEDK